jgi:hypothetical protein
MSLHPSPPRAAAAALAALSLTAAAPAAAAPRRLLNRPVAVAAAAKPAAAVYGGHTSQFDPIGLEVSRGGRLRGLVLHVETDCDNGDGYSWSGPARLASSLPATPQPGVNVFAPAKVARAGTFSAAGHVVADYGATVGDVTEKLAGRLRGGKGRGTLEATIEVSDRASGQHVTTCHSGPLRWTARSAPGRVYAGQTSDGRPVVVERSRSGSKVTTFWVTYVAACQSGDSFGVGEGITNFPISGGSFGDKWTDEEKDSGGGKLALAYRLVGDAGRSRASGVFQAQVAVIDAGGQTKDTCDTTPLSWSARSTKGKVPKEKFVVIRLGP